MTIIVGRGRSKATQRIEITDPTVSREHCWLTDNGDGTYTLQNKSPQGTFVDGRQVVKTRVTPDTYIKLSDTTTLKVSDLLPLPQSTAQQPKQPAAPVQKQVPEFSIRGLESIWDKYEREKEALSEKQQKMGMLVRVPMLFTALAGILSAVLPPDYIPFTIILTVISALIMVYGFVQQKSFNYQNEMNRLNKRMMDDYVCPNPDCHHFLGLQDYKVLRTDKKCRYCGCKLNEK